MADMNDSLTLIESENEKSCQTELEFKNASTQTEYSQSSYITTITTHFNFSHVSDLMSIFVDSIKQFNGKHRRILSVMIYLLLRQINVPFQSAQHPDIDVFKLDEDEWNEAVRSKPELLTNDETLQYLRKIQRLT